MTTVAQVIGRVILKGPVLVRAALALVVLAALTLIGGFMATNVVLVDLSILFSIAAAALMIGARRRSS